VDRAEARRRRRRKGHIRLAVAVAILVAVIVAIVLLLRGCGGGAAEETPGPQATPTSGTGAAADATPKPVSTRPPLVGLGDTVRFQTPEGAVVRVTVGDYADPGDAPSGVAAEAGERLVTLKLSVTAEGAAGAAEATLPFEKADSFILVAEDDTLTAAQLSGEGLFGGSLPPGKTTTSTLAFSVGASDPIRFVCTPMEGSLPRSATWVLGD
jgi:hypothetical protein